MFVQDALGSHEGDFEPNLILIRTAEGFYRKASGQDLITLSQEHPRFIQESKNDIEMNAIIGDRLTATACLRVWSVAALRSCALHAFIDRGFREERE